MGEDIRVLRTMLVFQHFSTWVGFCQTRVDRTYGNIFLTMLLLLQRIHVKQRRNRRHIHVPFILCSGCFPGSCFRALWFIALISFGGNSGLAGVCHRRCRLHPKRSRRRGWRVAGGEVHLHEAPARQLCSRQLVVNQIAFLFSRGVGFVDLD